MRVLNRGEQVRILGTEKDLCGLSERAQLAREREAPQPVDARQHAVPGHDVREAVEGLLGFRGRGRGVTESQLVERDHRRDDRD